MTNLNLIPKESRYVSAWPIIVLIFFALGLTFFLGQLVAVRSQEVKDLQAQLEQLHVENNEHRGERVLNELKDLKLQLSKLNALKQEYSQKGKPYWKYIYQVWTSSQGVDNIELLKLDVTMERIQLKYSADSLLRGGDLLTEIENSEMFYTTKVILATQSHLGQQGYYIDVEVFLED